MVIFLHVVYHFTGESIIYTFIPITTLLASFSSEDSCTKRFST